MSTEDNKAEGTGYWRDFFSRNRLSLRNTRSNRELWYTYISPMTIITNVVMLVVVVFAIVITIVGYSPLLEHLPGYRSEAIRSREEIIDNIIRLDSLEGVIEQMMVYSQNVATIMDGRVIEVKREVELKGNKESRETVVANSVDSALRREMEGPGRYNIHMAEMHSGSPIFKPINGIVSKNFNIRDEVFGVEITAAAGERVLALQDGVVLLSSWNPNGGYSVSILHSDNLVTIYDNLSQSIVKRGEHIKGGKVIGYNSEEITRRDGVREVVCRPIIFEMWSGANPINPERYITF